MLRELWNNERDIVELLFSIPKVEGGASHPCDMFFIETVAVPPNCFRPPSVLMGERYVHAQTSHFEKIIRTCLSLTSLRSKGKEYDLTEATRQCLEWPLALE